MTRPTDPIPEWATGPDAQIDTPAGGEVANGWRPGDKPPASYINWFWRRASEWLAYIVGAFETEHNADGSHGAITAGSVQSETAIAANPSDGFLYSPGESDFEISISPFLGGWFHVDPVDHTMGVYVQAATLSGATLTFDVSRLFEESAARGAYVTINSFEIHYMSTAGTLFVGFGRRLRSDPLHYEPLATASYGNTSGDHKIETLSIAGGAQLQPGYTYVLLAWLTPSAVVDDVILGHVVIQGSKTRIE